MRDVVVHQFSDVCVVLGLGSQAPSCVWLEGAGGTSHAGTMPAGMETVYIKGWHSVRIGIL